MTLAPLPRLIIEPLVRNALLEDLGLAGDVTSTAVIPADHRSVVVMAAREEGVVAGLDAAELAFQLVDPAITIERNVQDLSLIHISEPTRLLSSSYAVFCLKKHNCFPKQLFLAF